MKKRIDQILMWVWPFVATVLTHLFQTNLAVSTCLYLVLPSIYISWRHRAFVQKALILSLVALPVLIVADYVAVTTGTWYFPESIFSARLFGVVTFEVLFWYVAWVYFIAMYYEYFLEEHCTRKLTSPRLKYVFLTFFLVLVAFLTVWSITGAFLKVPYFYLFFGIVFAVIPIASVLIRAPVLLNKFAEATAYFSILGLLWELVAVPLRQWTFPGNSFVGWIELFGIRFPFEEFFVWILLGAAAILSWYEFFDDDQK